MPGPRLRKQTATIDLCRYRPIAKAQRRSGSTPRVDGAVCTRPLGRGSKLGCSCLQPVAGRWSPEPARPVAAPSPVHHRDPPSHPPPPIAARPGGTLARGLDPLLCITSRCAKETPDGSVCSRRTRASRRPDGRRRQRPGAEGLSLTHRAGWVSLFSSGGVSRNFHYGLPAAGVYP